MQLAAKVPEKRPLHLAKMSTQTPFNDAFASQLVSALIAQGFTVQTTSAGALNLLIHTQAVSFSPTRPQYGYAGAASELSSSVWAIRDINTSLASARESGVDGKDFDQWFHSQFVTGATPNTELIVTASISDDTKYLTQRTNIYYLANADRRLYEETPKIQIFTKNIGVTGS